jgi:N-acyl-D-amino-acid deacylase
MTRPTLASIALIAATFAGCSKPPAFDVVIRHGTIYDGTGSTGRAADVAILDDRIAAIGDLRSER